MNQNLLIDAIVRQTTVLVAQLSTAAGLRSPLAHVADQVFLELSRELEAQGLGKRVVADMFGMLLRGYQKKIQRLTESSSVRGRSLWQAVLEYVQAQPSITRAAVLQRFERDGDEAVGSVLHDLSSSGLVFAAGQGRGTIYRAASEADRIALLEASELDHVAPMLWATIFHQPGASLEQLHKLLSVPRPALESALLSLKADGRVSADNWDDFSGLRAQQLTVPVGAEVGWEAAVFDHFQAMVTAIAAKVQRRKLQTTQRDAIGGATLRFEFAKDHPQAETIFALLEDTRERLNTLWNEAQKYNEQHPLDPNQTIQCCFYFGQSVVEPNDE